MIFELFLKILLFSRRFAHKFRKISPRANRHPVLTDWTKHLVHIWGHWAKGKGTNIPVQFLLGRILNKSIVSIRFPPGSFTPTSISMVFIPWSRDVSDREMVAVLQDIVKKTEERAKQSNWELFCDCWVAANGLYLCLIQNLSFCSAENQTQSYC